MCGIAGYSWSDKSLIKKMAKAIGHRGPDAYGDWQDEKMTLGHRRLSIIDLNPRSGQPMEYEYKGKRAVISFNGEIYNYLGLKKELENAGYSFKTTSDTEVVLASYLRWGENCIRKFDGMFAFAIYCEDRIFFARDSAGEKPFYYFYDGKRFAFASELKALLQIPEIKLNIDQEAIDLYLSFNFIPAPWTIYREFKKLRASSYGIFDLKTKALEIKEYREFPKYNPGTASEGEISSAIEQAVYSRLIADVPVGLILSGGLDSTSVAYFASKKIDNIKAYSVEFEVNDESRLAEQFADELGIEFKRVPFNKEDFEKMKEMIFYQYDEPFGDHSSFPTTKVSQYARKDMTVALSGDGGDEVFGGYDYYKKAYMMEKIRQFKNPIQDLAVNVLGQINRKTSEFKEAYFQPWENFKTFSSSPERYSTETARNLSRKTLKSLLEIYPPVEALVKYDYTFNNLPDHFLVKTDRATMKWSLELRSPFLSKELWEISSKISYKEKVQPKTKNIMRKVMKNKLPEYLLKRKKQGFGAPIIDYMLSEKDKISEDMHNLAKRLPERHKQFVEYSAKKTKNSEFMINSMQYRVYALEMWFQSWHDKIGEATK